MARTIWEMISKFLVWVPIALSVVACGSSAKMSQLLSDCSVLGAAVESVLKNFSTSATNACESDSDCTTVVGDIITNGSTCVGGCFSATSKTYASAYNTFIANDPNLARTCAQFLGAGCKAALQAPHPCPAVTSVCIAGMCARK